MIETYNVILQDSFFNTIAEGKASLRHSYNSFLKDTIEIDASVNNYSIKNPPLGIVDKYPDCPIKNKLVLNDISHLFIELFAKSKNISVKQAELLVSNILFDKKEII